MVHELKTHPEFYSRVICGDKTFEIRRDDRGFQGGDVLVLREWCPGQKEYTGREAKRRVTYVLSTHAGLANGFVIMGLGKLCQ